MSYGELETMNEQAQEIVLSVQHVKRKSVENGLYMMSRSTRAGEISVLGAERGRKDDHDPDAGGSDQTDLRQDRGLRL